MKWLLVSTIGKNPGDEFIRIGISNVIKLVDKQATGVVVDKETQSIFAPQQFDKCIWAGMPVFWSLFNNNSWNVPWWNVLTRGWVSDSKNKFCVLGAGSFQDATNVTRGLNNKKLHEEASILNERSFCVVVRDPIANQITNLDFPVQVCPAILAAQDLEKTASIKGCNLMPNGSHYSEFNPFESKQWSEKIKFLSEELKNNNFYFFAHNDQETKFAEQLGWSKEKIISYTGDTKLFLKHYRNVDKFFGNRVHGCIVSRGNSADVISCGYDSRQSAVKLSGAKTLLPSELNLNKISLWAKEDSQTNVLNIETITEYYKGVLSEFLTQK